jgi:diguanylate cyclase (GGDEF)-like protein
VVDDDVEVHRATAFAIGDLFFFGRPLELLNAYSGKEALAILRREKGIAAVLLDVVMETATAGLDIIAAIREELGLNNLRIILRTGQPGYAPELETIRRYDINDYKTKNELTRNKLFATLSAALRTYDQICRIDTSRRQLEDIVLASRRLLLSPDPVRYAAESLELVSAFLGVPADGLICAAADPDESMTIIAGAGRYEKLANRPLAEAIPLQVSKLVARCIGERHCLQDDNGVALCLSGVGSGLLAGYIHLDQPAEFDTRLLEVFCSNIAVGAEKVSLLEKLRTAAYVDTLTGLPNRAALLERLGQCGNGADCRDKVLALVDIDQFSAINDMFGHSYGDQLLRAVAQKLNVGLGNGCMVARVGNDTFAIFGEAGLVSSDTLRPLLSSPFHFGDAEHMISISIGAGRLLDHQSGDLTGLLKDAWIALKRAKMSGQGQDAWFTPSAGEETREHTRLLHALRNAFRLDRLFLVYQPQVDLKNGHIIGVEALLRWRNDEGVFIPPDRFIPIAESSGLIIDLGDWVLRTALRAADEIRSAGHPGITMAVNVSAPQFAHANFLDRLDNALDASGTPPEGLELEITESVALMGADYVEGLLRAVKQRGISVAIDDFGTGYSSLSYLDRLPADRLKIDRSFVNALHAGERGARIAEMVIPLGNQLGMKVLAEGIETAEQAERLTQLGCHEAQGYLYARPMPLQELLAWLENQRAKASGQPL